MNAGTPLVWFLLASSALGASRSPVLGTPAGAVGTLREHTQEEVALTLFESLGRDRWPNGHSITPGQREQALEELSRRPRAQMELLRERALSGTSGERAVMLSILRRVGDPRDIEFALELAASGGNGAKGQVLEPLQGCLAELLARHPERLRDGRKLVLWASKRLDCDPAAEALVCALGIVGGEGAFQALLDMAPYEDTWSVAALRELRRTASSLRRQGDHELADLGREHLQSNEPRLRREACLLLSNSRRAADVPALILALEDAQAAVHEAALSSLRKLGGVDLPARVDRWQRWLQAEEEWYRSRYPQLEELLVRGDAALALRAIGEASAHPLYRRELAPLLEQAVGHPHAGVRWAALK